MLDFEKLAGKIYGSGQEDGTTGATPAAADPMRVILPGEEVGKADVEALNPERFPVREAPKPDGEPPAAPTEEELRYAIPLTKAGEEAAKWYADRYVETGDARYVVGGVMASLWTPETAGQTLEALMSALQKNGYENRSYTRYTGPKSSPEDIWGTRSPLWDPPYGADYARARDALQIPNEITGHHQFKPPWYVPMLGPRKVEGNERFGAGGGVEYYRGWKWPGNTPKGTD